ncbi:MAG: pseudouridine synthase [Bacteroidota bacterium]
MRAKSYILFFKPFGVLCQFSPMAGKQTLKDFGPFPPHVYPVGRLDADSEGLLLLTNDNDVKHRLTDPKFGHARTYLVQVEGSPDEQAILRLQNGVVIEGKKTRPAKAMLLTDEQSLPPRPVPVRFRKSIPTAWIELTLREGRNRQVRKMTAAVGHPTLRLIRVKIGSLDVGKMKPGEWRELTVREVEESHQ